MNSAVESQLHSRFVEVLGSKIHYLEAGEGAPILLLHGIPASSYLWRKIIPQLSGLGRCLAPDLIGYGLSAKPEIAYSIEDHVRYIDAWINELGLKDVVLIMHGWGSLVGLHYAMQHQNNCKGLVFYEGFLHPLHYADISPPCYEQFSDLKRQATHISTNPALFVDKVMSQSIMEPLAADVLDEYRKPFVEHSDKPLQAYLAELPYWNKKIDTMLVEYSTALQSSSIPKLLLYSTPGFQTTMSTLMWAKEHLPHIELIEVGEGYDYAQETNPLLMGQSISIWLQSIEQ